MRFKVDQNLPAEIVDALRVAGHDAMTVDEEALSGTLDPRLAEIIRIEGRAIVTLDKGFSDIRTYPPADYHGLIVLRPPRQDKSTVLRVFARVVPLSRHEPLVGRLWVVDERRIRMRG